MSFAHRIVYPCCCRAKSDPPQPLNREIAVGFISLRCPRAIVQWMAEFANYSVRIVGFVGAGLVHRDDFGHLFMRRRWQALTSSSRVRLPSRDEGREIPRIETR